MTNKEMLAKWAPTEEELGTYHKLERYYHLLDIETELATVFGISAQDLQEETIVEILKAYEDKLEEESDWAYKCDVAIRGVIRDKAKAIVTIE